MRLRFFVAVLAAACAAPRPAPAPAAPAAPKVVATPFGPQRLARVQAAYASLQPLLAEWKLEGYGQDCLLVFTDREEWLLGCGAMSGSAGFAPTGEVWNGAPVLWNPRSLVVSGKEMPYEQIKLSL